MNKYDILVIGGGPAAITIAKTIQGKLSVGIIRPEDHSMIYCAMPYAIEGLLPFEKTLKKDAIVTEAKASLIRDKVTKVNFHAKTVETEKSGEIAYGKLVIATGATPVLPPIPGRDLNGVMTFKTANDLQRIMEQVDNGLKKAVVVGAGAIGIELAQALNERNVETHLVDMGDYILPNMVDYGIVERTQESLIKSGVKLHLKSKVTALQGETVVEEVLLENMQIIHFDQMDHCSEAGTAILPGLVVFAVGMKPNIELFADTDLKTERDGIVVDNKLATNIDSVYAAGDCCQFTSGITGEVISGKLATNAVPMARVLANNFLGKDRTYPGFFNGTATRIGDFYIGGTGFSETTARKHFDVEVGYAEFTTAFPIMPDTTKIRLKLIADKNTHKIVGGQFVSGKPVTDKVDKITMAIQYGITLEQLVNFSYSAQPYQSFYPAHNLIVKAAESILRKISS
ncbi:MAG: FAD-dependent oxidoreductase [Candidatus Sabulitectum sp.]|nr:FAD-dependent oxidoreductase [Candidatus Sabulitectum sp.]